MLPMSIGVSSQAAASAASFSASLSNNSAPEIVLFEEGLPSDEGALDFSVSASGGSGSYTYGWQIEIVDSGAGMVSVESQGTTNTAAFQEATVVGGANQGALAAIRAKCIVRDGVASPITLVSDAIDVISLY